MTLKGFNDSKWLLDRSQNFDMLEGEKITIMLPGSWKKSFSNSINIPVKMRRCNEWKGKLLCDECENQVNEDKKIESNSNLLTRDVLHQFGHMLPYYEL